MFNLLLNSGIKKNLNRIASKRKRCTMEFEIKGQKASHNAKTTLSKTKVLRLKLQKNGKNRKID